MQLLFIIPVPSLSFTKQKLIKKREESEISFIIKHMAHAYIIFTPS